jgi:hypothetical protein
MDPRDWALQTLAAIESESRDVVAAMESEKRDLTNAEAPSTPKTETDVEIAPLIHKVGTTSIVEIEKLMGEMQEARNFLQSEWERIQRETARYMNLTQVASESVKVIFDVVSGWRKAGHPINQSRASGFEITPSTAEVCRD